LRSRYVDNNRQLSEANTKLKADLKRATDELNELRAQVDRIRSEALKLSDTQSQLLALRSREDDYKSQIASLTTRLHALEDELHSRLIDNEDVHQQAQAFAGERRAMQERVAQMEAVLKERDRLILEYTARNKELNVNLHMEQEQQVKLRAE